MQVRDVVPPEAKGTPVGNHGAVEMGLARSPSPADRPVYLPQHYRGQGMTRLKDFGGKPTNVDWSIALWKQKPRARWG